MAVAVQLLALRLPQAVISQTTSHVIPMQFKHFCTQFLCHPKGSANADSVFFSDVDPRIWIRIGFVTDADPVGFNVDPDPAFYLIADPDPDPGNKPMPINADTDPDPVTKKWSFYMKNILKV